MSDMEEHNEIALTDAAAAEREQLLADLERVSRDELPDGAARDALAEAIRCGEVDALYRPLGYRYHNATLAGCRLTSIRASGSRCGAAGGMRARARLMSASPSTRATSGKARQDTPENGRQTRCSDNLAARRTERHGNTSD